MCQNVGFILEIIIFLLLLKAFIAENTPSPLQIGEDALPTDLSDTSTESDINPNGGMPYWNVRLNIIQFFDVYLMFLVFIEKIMTSCSSTHEGRHVISIILPMHVDQLFTLMFTNSKFFFEFHTMRQSSDIHASTWHQSPESGEKIRTINMVVTLGQALAPKSAHVHQTQVGISSLVLFLFGYEVPENFKRKTLHAGDVAVQCVWSVVLH